jgi:hypothetical protein
MRTDEAREPPAMNKELQSREVPGDLGLSSHLFGARPAPIKVARVTEERQ